MARFRAGTLEDFGLYKAIVTTAFSLEGEYGLFKGMNPDDVFNEMLEVTLRYQGPNETAFKIFTDDASSSGNNIHRTDELAVAAYLGESGVVQSLLDQGQDPNSLSKYFGLALTAAAGRGHHGTVKLLLRGGAKLVKSGMLSWTALEAAASAGHEEIVHILFDTSQKFHITEDVRRKTLYLSVNRKLVSSTFLILDNTSWTNPSTIYQEVLLEASKSGCLPLVRAAIEKGADVNNIAQVVRSPLMDAARRGHTDVVSFLLAQGARQDVSLPLVGDPLYASTIYGYIDTIRVLLKHDVNINSQAYSRLVPLVHAAARHNQAETIRFLLRIGVKVDLISDGDNDEMSTLGYESLEYATERGYTAVIQALAEGGADVKTVPPGYLDSHPPLVLLAKMWGQSDVVKLLLTLGAEDVDPSETKWAEDFRKGTFPKSAWTLRSRCTA